MNEFIVNGTALGSVEVSTSESGTKYGSLKLKVKKSFRNKDNTYDDDLFQVTLFKSLLEEAESICDGTAVLIRGHLNSNNYMKDGKLYCNTSLIADRIESI